MRGNQPIRISDCDLWLVEAMGAHLAECNCCGVLIPVGLFFDVDDADIEYYQRGIKFLRHDVHLFQCRKCDITIRVNVVGFK